MFRNLLLFVHTRSPDREGVRSCVPPCAFTANMKWSGEEGSSRTQSWSRSSCKRSMRRYAALVIHNSCKVAHR